MRLINVTGLLIIGFYECYFDSIIIPSAYGFTSSPKLGLLTSPLSPVFFNGGNNINKVERNVKHRRVHISTTSCMFANPRDNRNDNKSNMLPAEEEEMMNRIPIPAYADTNDDDEEDRYPSPLHSINIHSEFLSTQQASHCLTLAQKYAEETSCWDTVDQIRHVNYRTADFSLLDGECPDLMSYLKEIKFHRRIFQAISNDFGLTDDTTDDDDLCLNYLDLFCVNYKAKPNINDSKNDDEDEDDRIFENEDLTGLDRLEPHRDGSLFSFTVLLSTPKLNFEGGGTYFDALSPTDDHNINAEEKSRHDHVVIYKQDGGGIVRPSHAGDAVLHSGKTLHGAEAITNGERTVLVGFVDIAENHKERFIRPDVLRIACRDWGRLDTSSWRYRRHSTQKQKRPMSLYQKPDEFNRSKHHSAWLFSIPTKNNKQSSPMSLLPSVHRRRADPIYQRQQRLKIEDVFLRNILLSRQERPEPSSLPSFLQENDEISELSEFIESNDFTVL